ncbi:phage major capsid protein [Halobellus limi]|nr:hypothetical protein [Halobellus limi]SEG35861.1 hypothetical protein SAMN04488133_2004 [Halobellus limi]
MLHTKDGVPLSELLARAEAELNLFNQAPRVIREMLGQNVDEQVFKVYTGDMEWEELAEGEHPRTGELASKEMAFSVSTFGRSLGMTQELIEDHSADYVLRRIDALAEGALKKEHDVVFNTIRGAWADGSGLWFTPEDYGNRSFSATHDHTYADTNDLFGDADAHTAREHLEILAEDVEEHGKVASIAIVGSDFARALKSELTWAASYNIPTFESLRTTSFPENGLEVDGLRVYKSMWVDATEAHVIAADERPLYFHERRPVQLSSGEYGGPVSDPATLLGAYGSARYGAIVPDPLAGAKIVAADNLA